MHKTLLSPPTLAKLMKNEAALTILDTRFALSNTEYGRNSFKAGHIPGAIYAHLDEDLSGPIIPGASGRHPLPDPLVFSKRLEGWGISNNSQVVIYDDNNGGIAARAWWMLRWLGHDAAAVLDGGWQTWQAFGGEESKEYTSVHTARFVVDLKPAYAKSSPEILAMRSDSDSVLLDARTADRYAGENETIDPVAGHIPGAVSASFKDTVNDEGISLSKVELQDLFTKKLAGIPPENAVFYCGSGVTACRSILAMEHAGLSGSTLYPGSWSEWINFSEDIDTGPNE